MLRILIVTNIFFITSQLYAQDSITLSSAIDIAIKNNIQLQKSRLSIKLEESNLKGSKFDLIPSLNANSSLNFSFGRSEDPFSSEFFNTAIASSSGSISTSIPIFQIPQKLKQISLNKFLLEASKNIMAKMENELKLNVITSYLEIFYNQDMMKAADLQLELAKKSLNLEQKQFDLGNHTVVDLSQAKALVAAAEQRKAATSKQLQLSSLNLQLLLEWPLDRQMKLAEIPLSIEIGTGLLTSSERDLFNDAVKIYPALKAAQLQKMAATKAVEIAKFNSLPRLSLQGGVGTGYSSVRQRSIWNGSGGFQNVPAAFLFQVKENFNQYIGLSLAIPLFNAGASRLAIQRSRINLESAALDEVIERNNFRKIVTQSLLDIETSVSQYVATKNAFDAAKAAYQAVEQRYKVGLVNSLLLSQAQTTVNVAEFDWIKARYDLFFRKATLKFYQGLPFDF